LRISTQYPWTATFMEVLDERKANGIADELGADASPINDDGTSMKGARRF